MNKLMHEQLNKLMHEWSKKNEWMDKQIDKCKNETK
jgi:hypothetical protein